jgi:glucose/arabinose dehydrogenase
MKAERRCGWRVSLLTRVVVGWLLATGCVSAQPGLEVVASGLTRPVYVTHAGDDRLFLVEQAGVIKVRQPHGAIAGFLDIRDRVGSRGNEQGLLSVAFHPGFAKNRRLFVYYTDRGGDTVVAEFRADASATKASPKSERRLLEVPQPYSNHNGGQLQFGPDGYLYIGLGDGGSGGDPLNAGQDRNTLLGALLRIDVDGAAPYSVPSDNPYAGGGGRAEIWATGLRNPWRFSFDRTTDDLYIADVGQNRLEEVSVQRAAGPAGANFGWRIREGTRCFDTRQCGVTGLVAPVMTYPRSEGCSITGGYVYRGKRYPQYSGHYWFGDFCSGTIWSMVETPAGWRRREQLRTDLRISSFGEDRRGELYVLDLNGKVYRLVWH